MTAIVPDEDTWTTYDVISASAGPFPFSFTFSGEKADLDVRVDGVVVDFTVSTGLAAEYAGYVGGNVTLVTAIQDARVAIARRTVTEREANLNGNQLTVNAINTRLNRQTMMIAENGRDVERALKVRFGDSVVPDLIWPTTGTVFLSVKDGVPLFTPGTETAAADLIQAVVDAAAEKALAQAAAAAAGLARDDAAAELLATSAIADLVEARYTAMQALVSVMGGDSVATYADISSIASTDNLWRYVRESGANHGLWNSPSGDTGWYQIDDDFSSRLSAFESQIASLTAASNAAVLTADMWARLEAYLVANPGLREMTYIADIAADIYAERNSLGHLVPANFNDVIKTHLPRSSDGLIINAVDTANLCIPGLNDFDVSRWKVNTDVTMSVVDVDDLAAGALKDYYVAAQGGLYERVFKFDNATLATERISAFGGVEIAGQHTVAADMFCTQGSAQISMANVSPFSAATVLNTGARLSTTATAGVGNPFRIQLAGSSTLYLGAPMLEAGGSASAYVRNKRGGNAVQLINPPTFQAARFLLRFRCPTEAVSGSEILMQSRNTDDDSTRFEVVLNWSAGVVQIGTQEGVMTENRIAIPLAYAPGVSNTLAFEIDADGGVSGCVDGGSVLSADANPNSMVGLDEINLGGNLLQSVALNSDTPDTFMSGRIEAFAMKVIA